VWKFSLSNQPYFRHHIAIVAPRTHIALAAPGSLNPASPHHPRLFDRRPSAIPSFRQCAACIRRREKYTERFGIMRPARDLARRFSVFSVESALSRDRSSHCH
jgi:hypothetical protein